jgi:hypothetical protein
LNGERQVFLGVRESQTTGERHDNELGSGEITDTKSLQAAAKGVRAWHIPSIQATLMSRFELYALTT